MNWVWSVTGMLLNRKGDVELDNFAKIIIGIILFLALLALIYFFNKSNLTILDNLGF
jgi:hypothetical protein